MIENIWFGEMAQLTHDCENLGSTPRFHMKETEDPVSRKKC